MFSGSYKGFQNAQTGRSRMGELQISQGRLRPKDDKERGGSYSWRVPQRQRKKGKDLKHKTLRKMKVFFPDPRRPQESDDPKPSGPRGQPLPCCQDQ